MPATECSSNWDFTAVINLIHTPAYAGYSAAAASSPGPEVYEGDVAYSKEQFEFEGNSSCFLGLQKEPSTTREKATRFSRLRGNASIPQLIAKEPKRIKVLKQPSRDAKNDNSSPDVLTSPLSRSTSVPGVPRAPSCRAEADVKAWMNSYDADGEITSPKRGLNQYSAEVDSDSAVHDFGMPVRKEPATLRLISARVSTSTQDNSSFDTPAPSYTSNDAIPDRKTAEDSPRNHHISVRPLAYKSAAERRVGLLTKLLNKFPDYADIVFQVGRPSKNNDHDSSVQCIHVFVDISNIMAGFHDSLKISRSIPIATKIPRRPLSFENLSLVLERGRRAKKRVLVGSDRLRVIEEAEKMGYETNILDRVQKWRHLAPRQPKHRRGQQLGAAGRPSFSEMNGTDKARWVEQGVDEILHLKILESLIDTDEPTTMVLATGDAAEAEYSEGFMKMIQRALKRGWAVELVSFSHNTSSEYRKPAFREKWGDRFKIIDLDMYTEELLDM